MSKKKIGELSKKELREWMEIYHDKWIKCHNKLIDLKDKKGRYSVGE